MAFYDKFESLCKDRGITPTQAARDNGIAQPAVSMWKKRGSTPKAETVQKLADYFKVPIAFFFNFNSPEMISDIADGFEFLVEVAPNAIVTRLDDKDDDDNAEMYVDFTGGLEMANAHAEAHALLDELNEIGALRVAGYIDELKTNPRYRRQDAPPPKPTEGPSEEETP